MESKYDLFTGAVSPSPYKAPDPLSFSNLSSTVLKKKPFGVEPKSPCPQGAPNAIGTCPSVLWRGKASNLKALLNTGGQVTILPHPKRGGNAQIQFMGFGPHAQWGRDANPTVQVGPFGIVQGTAIVAYTDECIIGIDFWHACIANAYKRQRDSPIQELLQCRRDMYVTL